MSLAIIDVLVSQSELWNSGTPNPIRIGSWLAVSVSNALTCAGHGLAKYTIPLRSTQIHTFDNLLFSFFLQSKFFAVFRIRMGYNCTKKINVCLIVAEL